jgi:formiminotetrahydrofolate cyclodeaminase
MRDAPSDSSSAAGDPYLRSTVADFLDALADRTPAPGGGAAAALTCAMAAGLVEMASSFASNLGALEDARRRAHTLRAESSRLAYADGRAYGVVLEALRLPKGPERTRRLDEAVSVSIQIPMRIMEIAAEVSALAAEIAETGNKNLEGDALSGALLAEASARSAATLAQLNVSMLSKHAAAAAHLERLRPALAKATRARERAVSAFAALERLTRGDRLPP